MNKKKCSQVSLLLLTMLVLFLPRATVHASIFDAVKDVVENETERQAEKLIRKGVRCAFNDPDCIERAERNGETVVLTNEDGEVLTDEKGAPISDRNDLPPEKRQASKPPTGQVEANYDFEAGDRTIFAEDFKEDNLGDFPRSLEFRKGNLEVVDWNGRRWLRSRTPGKFAVALGEQLPETFTIEFELYIQESRPDGVRIFTTDDSRHQGVYYEHNYFKIGGRHATGVVSGNRSDGPSSNSDADAMHEGVATARIMVDGSYAKVYVNKRRVANVPNADLPRTDKLWFLVDGRQDAPTYLTDLRIAAGGKDLYDALATEGRVSVQEILFDTDSAKIKASSSQILEEIAQLLQERPGLKLLIEGHTDDQGGFQHNMQLSGKRAAAVKAHLVEQHGISSDRLETIGLGSTQPTVSNDTERGRSENRRVELVRIDDDS